MDVVFLGALAYFGYSTLKDNTNKDLDANELDANGNYAENYTNNVNRGQSVYGSRKFNKVDFVDTELPIQYKNVSEETNIFPSGFFMIPLVDKTFPTE